MRKVVGVLFLGIIVSFICKEIIFNGSFQIESKEYEMDTVPIVYLADSTEEFTNVTTEEYVVKIEKDDAEIISFPSLFDAKMADLYVGNRIYTDGYYESDDGGAAEYIIVSDIKEDRIYEEIGNGLYAELIVNNDTIYVEQVGAYGDGMHDDTKAIQKAFDSSVTTVAFREKNYRCLSSITVINSNKVIRGNNGTIITDANYSDDKEWFILIKDCKNITILDLDIVTSSTSHSIYKTQLGIANASKIKIENCVFSVLESVRDSIYFSQENTHFNNLDLYSNWHNVSVNNCTFSLQHDGEGGGCIWIRDMKGLGSDGLVFQNNSCTKVSHDEILAIYIGEVRDVIIENNEFTMYENIASPSVQCFTVGSKTSVNTGNIKFVDNKINVTSKMGLFFWGNVDNVDIRNNNINYNKSDESFKCFLFYNLEETNATNINVDSNNIIINASDNENEICSCFYTKDMNVTNNVVDCYANITEVFSKSYLVKNNVFNMYGETNVFASDVQSFEDNCLNLQNRISIVFRYNNLMADSVLLNNKINIGNYNNKNVTLIMAEKALLNDNSIILKNNKICNENKLKNSRLYYLQVLDETMQKLVVEDNTIIGFNREESLEANNLYVKFDRNSME